MPLNEPPPHENFLRTPLTSGVVICYLVTLQWRAEGRRTGRRPRASKAGGASRD